MNILTCFKAVPDLDKMTDEDVDLFYSCTLCQSFAPNHVCSVSPERTGLCGAYNWMDCKASYEINPTGPNQPIAAVATPKALRPNANTRIFWRMVPKTRREKSTASGTLTR